MAESTVSKADFLAQLKMKTAQPKNTEPKNTEPKVTEQKAAVAKPAQPEPTQPKADKEIRLDTPEGLSETVAALLARARKENQSQMAARQTFQSQKPLFGSIIPTVPAPSTQTKRVAAYIRVSSENLNQEDSYATQERYFTQLLRSDPSCVSAGIYSDYGISATSDHNRTGFKRLLRHCRDGRIDRVVCKSISRFARNTQDFLSALDQLKKSGVTIAFEKEGLDTAEPVSEFVMTLLAALAQQESRTISENILWGIQKRYKQGIVPNCEIYGYRFLEKAEGDAVRGVEIVEEEAEVVRYVFEQAAEGVPCTKIAQELNRRGTPAPRQRTMKKGKRGRNNDDVEVGWTGQRLRAMIKNERYCGDVTAQKTFVSDFLTHKSSKNNGEMPIYHLKDHHPAIISRELYESVQIHRTGTTRSTEEIPFSGKLRCPYCGRFYNSRNRKCHPIWFCPNAELNNGKNVCSAERVYEQQVIYAVRKGVAERYRLFDYGNEDDEALDEILETLTDTVHFTNQADGFLKDVRLTLLRLQDEDCNETERAFLKKNIAALQAELASAQNRVRVAESKIDAMKIRAEIMGEPVGDLTRLEAAVANGKRKAEALSNELEAAEKEMQEKEDYWRELEYNYEWRRQALAWIDTLPEGRDGTQAFLNGLTDVYVKAFILDITIYSPLKYSIRWFDNTRTEVVMHSNVEDYRNSASYWDGSKMRENPRGKYGNLKYGKGRLYG